MNLHGWSLDDALTEFTEVRGDMASLLQARVALPKKLENTTAPRRPLGAKGKAKGASVPQALLSLAPGRMRFLTSPLSCACLAPHFVCGQPPRSDG